tara:strand:+ start:1781 stop:3238 length:1458 start_codon:yes stop_codon:yes gene_type:complete
MSTKINVRSPYFLAYSEPTVPTPVFDCFIANPRNFSINQQGILTLPTLDYGTITAVSTEKYATVTSPTSRTVTLTIQIPTGFSNTDTDGFITCDVSATQPAFVAGTTCTQNVTTSGSIPAQTITVGGNSKTVDLSSYFSGGSIAGYNIINFHTNLVTAGVNSNTLTLTSNQIGGTKTIYVEAFESASGTCTAVQSIAVTVNGLSSAFDCTAANLANGGGSIAQNGTITDPTSIAEITAKSLTSGGGHITSVAANSGSSAIDVTLFFDLTAPAGYTNAGATVICSKTFKQQATSTLPTFDCDTANLTEQGISTRGDIHIGKTQLGTIQGFSPINFAEVTTETNRSIDFTVLIPSGYSNTGDGSQTLTCTKTITQPASLGVCGSNDYFISSGKASPTDFCDGTFPTTTAIVSTASNKETGKGKTVCKQGTAFAGQNLYYAVSTVSINAGAGIGVGSYILWLIDNNGIVTNVAIANCDIGGSGSFTNL